MRQKTQTRLLTKGKEPERVSDEDEVESEGESSSESESDSEELMGSAETSDFPKDTELALDNLGMLALEGETSSGGVIEKAVDVLQGPNTVDLATSRSTSVDNFQHIPVEQGHVNSPRESMQQEAHAATHSDTNEVPSRPSTSSSEIVSQETVGRRERRKRKIVDIGGLDDCLSGSRAEPTANNVIQCKRIGCETVWAAPASLFHEPPRTLIHYFPSTIFRHLQLTFCPLGLLLITFDDRISQGFADWDSPPNTPQRHRNIERAREHQERMLESPEHRRTPQNPAVGGGVPFILPFPIPPPVAPFQIPQGPVGDDPFVEVLYNGQILHLTPGMAAQVGNLQNQAHAAPLAAPPPLFPPAAMVDVALRMCGNEFTFHSADSIMREGGVDGEFEYPVEYLNSINLSGMPLAKLVFGSPVS
ncbi:uncharacterized protein LACBIDRAFT_331543 [Laccaria bicolor S238N-H82]|uniref:Predicted protein n=1 Tax=Laccaria bicolor (strain S238N-H82 / ATCC MYA-4686) TaxID=486041 RepID=B0DPT2_LACBS|nr:uncharacterized protein LACBIDRAFT_331543 [Laccaria bicolor S238N-H82]EDR03508.1 predicted protein [Laccaria bicolor S238N-H82]|eukprot:XP_001885964.1 predicted protein [Laccaria bicolor S238N-H82]